MSVSDREIKILLEGMARTALALILLEQRGMPVSEQKRVLAQQYDLAARLLETCAETRAPTEKG